MVRALSLSRGIACAQWSVDVQDLIASLGEPIDLEPESSEFGSSDDSSTDLSQSVSAISHFPLYSDLSVYLLRVTNHYNASAPQL